MNDDYLDQVYARFNTFQANKDLSFDGEEVDLCEGFLDLTAGENSVADLMPPTEEQQGFLDLVLRDCPPLVVALRGGGGTGKTWTLAAMARRLAPGKVLFLSVTHQARTVLEEELRQSEGLKNAKTSTVAGFLKRQPLKDFVPDGTYQTPFSDETDAGDLTQFAVVVVDEAFMVPREDILAILKVCEEYNITTTILAGDPAQLPPINSVSYLPTLETAHKIGKAGSVLLTKNQRAESSGLAQFIEYVRQHHVLPPDTPPEVTYYNNPYPFIQAAARILKAAGSVETETPMILAWRNATVGKMMVELRKAMGYPLNRAVLGEILRVDSAFSLYTWREVFDYLKNRGVANAYEVTKPLLRETRIHPGTLLKVVNPGRLRPFGTAWATNATEVQDATVEILNGPRAGHQLMVPLAELTAKIDPMSQTTLFLDEVKLVVDLTRRLGSAAPADPRIRALLNFVGRDKISQLAHKGFYDVRDEGLCFVMPSSTLTVHRAQGSGRDHVFVTWDDLQGDDQDELRYVAVSRARKHLHIYRR